MTLQNYKNGKTKKATDKIQLLTQYLLSFGSEKLVPFSTANQVFTDLFLTTTKLSFLRRNDNFFILRVTLHQGWYFCPPPHFLRIKN